MSDIGFRSFSLAAIAMAVVCALNSSDVSAQTAASGNSAGKDLFDKRCAGCHSVDKDKEGPRLAGVYGRAAGAVPTFSYSEPMKKARIVWNDETLDRWLTDPEKMVPGTDMEFHVAKADERKAIIEWLKTQA
jgi:cytochrome c